MSAARRLTLALLCAAAAPLAAARAQHFSFNTGDPDGRIGIGARPGAPLEIEAADDFILSRRTRLNSATFTGLVPVGFDLSGVNFARVQIYQVFPGSSDQTRTPNVPSRVNSPGDVALLQRESGAGLTYTTTSLAPEFSAGNSVLNGINPIPDFLTGGEGAIRGQEISVNVTFTDPIFLDAGHYFFVPQAGLGGDGNNFFWLSAVRPIVPPGTPFAPDLQAWVRNANLDPDWLRVGQDIVGGDARFNAAFSLDGRVVPEPSTWALVGTGLAAVAAAARRRRASA